MDINFITNSTRITYFLRLRSAQYKGSLEMLQSNIIFKKTVLMLGTQNNI